jgi:hypothetical protein
VKLGLRFSRKEEMPSFASGLTSVAIMTRRSIWSALAAPRDREPSQLSGRC